MKVKKKSIQFINQLFFPLVLLKFCLLFDLTDDLVFTT